MRFFAHVFHGKSIKSIYVLYRRRAYLITFQHNIILAYRYTNRYIGIHIHHLAQFKRRTRERDYEMSDGKGEQQRVDDKEK